jgi:hypothetical protein
VDHGGGLLGGIYGFGASILAPKGFLSDNSSLALVRSLSAVLPDQCFGVSPIVRLQVQGDGNLHEGITMRLQHNLGEVGAPTNVGHSKRNSVLRVMTRSEGKGGVWTQVDDADVDVDDQGAAFYLKPGQLPSHVALVASHRAALCATALAYAEVGRNDSSGGCSVAPQVVVWLVPDRDDARAAVAQRMARRHSAMGEWRLVAEAVECLYLSHGTRVIVRVDGSEPNERAFKDGGVAFQLAVGPGAGTHARVSLQTAAAASQDIENDETDAIELYMPRPSMPAPPPPEVCLYQILILLNAYQDPYTIYF